jgi:lysophospholipase L1-like esterase
MTRNRWICVTLLLTLLAYQLAQGEELAASSGMKPPAETYAARQELLKNAQRILFLGDSITASGGYVVDFETWRVLRRDAEPRPLINMGLASETTSGLSEEGHAGGKFPRPDLFERLARVLALAKPDLVFACYGMNDGIYEPLDEARFAKYREGMTRLKAAVEKAGAKFIAITPPFYDSQKNSSKDFYDGVLAKYAEWLNERASKDSWQVIDLHTAMADEVTARRITRPNFTFASDGVHPNKDGHWFMARQLIGWFGDLEAAKASDVAQILQQKAAPEKLHALLVQRSATLRDAYVATAGHQRPGVAKGLPLEEAERKTAGFTDQIKKALAGQK